MDRMTFCFVFFIFYIQIGNTDKGTIRIPYGKIDADLIARIAAWCMVTDQHA